MTSQTECVICYGTIDIRQNITFANCVHGNCVHAACMIHWNETCPLCRTNVYDDRHTVDDMITEAFIHPREEITPHHEDEIIPIRDDIIIHRNDNIIPLRDDIIIHRNDNIIPRNDNIIHRNDINDDRIHNYVNVLINNNMINNIHVDHIYHTMINMINSNNNDMINLINHHNGITNNDMNNLIDIFINNNYQHYINPQVIPIRT